MQVSDGKRGTAGAPASTYASAFDQAIAADLSHSRGYGRARGLTSLRPLLILGGLCGLLLVAVWLSLFDEYYVSPGMHTLSNHLWFAVAITLLTAAFAVTAILQFRGHLKNARALADSEARYRAFISRTSRIVWTTDARGNAIVDSPQWREYTGQSFEQFRHSGWADAVHPEDRAEVSRKWQNALRDRVVHEVEYRLRGADGVYRPFSCRAVPVLDEYARVREWVGVVEDISERIAAQHAHELLATIVENASDAIVSRDRNGIITSWNAAAERIFGYAASEAIGQSLPAIHVDSLDGYRDRSERVLRGEVLKPQEGVRRRKDGMIVNVVYSIFPIRDAGGDIVGTAGISTDVTELQKVSETRALLASIVEYCNDAIISRDMDGIITSWNRAAEAIFGYTAEEAVGRHLSLIMFDDDIARYPERSARIAAGQANLPREGVRRTKDGRCINVVSGAFPVFNAAGEVVAAGAVYRDVTEQHKAAETRALLAAIVNNATDAIISRDLDGTVTSWNAAATRMFGYTAEEAVGRHLSFLNSPGDPDLNALNNERIRNGEAVPAQDGFRRAKDGTLVHVARSLSPIRNEAGDVVGVATVLRDISALRKAEADLRLAATVYENAAEGLAITDADDRILWINRAYTEITGDAAAEASGRPPRILNASEERGKLQGLMMQDVRSSGRWSGEVWTTARDGRRVCLLLSVSSFFDLEGGPARHCWIFMDITARKQSEQALVAMNAELEDRVVERTRKLEHANQELRSFSYSVSHDLRAPIRAIQGFSTLLLAEEAASLTDSGRARLERVSENAKWMGRLIDDLLRLASVSQRQLVRKEFDLTAMAEDIVSRLRREEPGRVVDVAIAPGMQANGDASLFESVMDNLIGNAWKFTSRTADARIEIGIDNGDGRTVHYVRDNGAGFEMKYAHKLFNAFQRLHRREEFDGTGIGLSIVHRIVTRHGGELWAHGETGRGAAFYFTLG